MIDDCFYHSADGLRLYCAVHPAARPGGLPVLCLPGLTRNSRDFTRLAEHLREQHEVLAPDLRGRGRSAWDPNPARYQLPSYVQDAWMLLDARGVQRLIIIGTSLGGMIGMTMAAMRPDRIAGLVLNDIGPELERAGLTRIAGYAGKLPPVRSWPEAAAQARSTHGVALPDLDEEGWLDFAKRGYRENAAGVPAPDVDPNIAQAIQAPTGPLPDLWPLYEQIRNVPMLVIRGALSDLLSAATVKRMLQGRPEVAGLTVAHRGHTPLLDEPECLSALDRFLDRYGRA